LDIFYWNFVDPLRKQFDNNVGFINECIDEFYRECLSSEENEFKFKEVKNIKIKLDELEAIQLSRLEKFYREEIQKEQNKFLVKKTKTFHMIRLNKLENLCKIHPEYTNKRLNNAVFSKIIEEKSFSSFFINSESKFYCSILIEKIRLMIQKTV
jgi:hypothetical protein